MASNEHLLDTFSGHKLNLDSPEAGQIELDDIAAALSKVCRFGAQPVRFHSVAQHAVLVMQLAAEDLGRPDLALWALHHDSHEAYLCDVPNPLKRKLRDDGNAVYDETSEALDGAIAEKFNCLKPAKGTPDADVIDRADDMALLVEARTLLRSGDAGVRPKTDFTDAERDALPELGASLSPERAEAVFRDAHSRAFATGS